MGGEAIVANVVGDYGIVIITQILIFPIFGLHRTLAQNMANREVRREAMGQCRATCQLVSILARSQRAAPKRSPCKVSRLEARRWLPRERDQHN